MPEVSSFHSILGRRSLVSNRTTPDDLETHYYTQTLDHFNFNPESYTTFLQKFYVDSKYWGGAKSNAPIFVHLGAESPMDKNGAHLGFLDENAPIFRALVLMIEHRFYGESNPLGSMKRTINNREMRGYFNSAQALADYAQIILHIKKSYSAQHSPVIVMGGSYGGMLAAWFRLKYPHIALGALASSAPILLNIDQLAHQDGYYSVVTNDFKGIDGAPDGADIIDKIFAGFRSIYPEIRCLNPSPMSSSPSSDSSNDWGWGWQFQVCTDMVMPMGITNDDRMFPKKPFTLSDFIAVCKIQFDATPRPHWATTYYGGQDIKLVLKKFGSSIIFSNGLRDPFSNGGVLEDISDTILAVNTEKGSHCLDILPSKEDDPKWLVEQRNREIHIIRGWITKYNQDLCDSQI